MTPTTSCTSLPSSSVTETQHLSLIPRPIPTESVMTTQIKLRQVATHILQHPNILDSLQQAALTFSSTEFIMFFKQNTTSLLERIKKPDSAVRAPCIYHIYNKNSPESKSPSIFVLSLGQDVRTGFYFARQFLGKGTQKHIVQIVSVVSAQEKRRQNYALAYCHKKYIEQYGISPGMFDQECRIVEMLHQRKVPYIINMQRILCYEPARTPAEPTTSPEPVRPQPFLLMEDCTFGSLAVHIRNISSQIRRMELCLQVLHAITNMHLAGVHHNDIKSSNICVQSTNEQEEIRIIDFDTARESNIGNPNEIGLCSTYPPPEMMHHKQHGKLTPVTQAIDLWALGELIFQLFTRQSLLKKWGLEHLSSNFDANYRRFSEHLTHLDSQQLHPIDLCVKQLFSKKPTDRPAAYIVLERITQWIQMEKDRLKDPQNVAKEWPSALFPNQSASSDTRPEKQP